MKKTTTYFKIIAFLMLMSLQDSAFAQTYYNVYMAENASATLKPDVTSPSTIVSTDEVIWTNTTTGTQVPKTGSDPNLSVLYADLAAGANSYTVVIRSAAGCLGDPSDAITIYKLPSATIALSTPTDPDYCTNQTATPASVLEATVSPAVALPSGVSFAYTWTVTKTLDGVNSNPSSSSIGSHSVSTTAPWKDSFTMNTRDVGNYNFSVKAVYAISAAVTTAGGVLISDGYEISLPAADKKDVIVSPKPTKPQITVSN